MEQVNCMPKVIILKMMTKTITANGSANSTEKGLWANWSK